MLHLRQEDLTPRLLSLAECSASPKLSCVVVIRRACAIVAGGVVQSIPGYEVGGAAGTVVHGSGHVAFQDVGDGRNIVGAGAAMGPGAGCRWVSWKLPIQKSLQSSRGDQIMSSASLLKIAGVVLIVVGMSGALAVPLFERRLLQESPRQYVPSQEYAHRVDLRGREISLTREEYVIYSMLFPVSAVLVVLGGGMLALAKRRRVRQWL